MMLFFLQPSLNAKRAYTFDTRQFKMRKNTSSAIVRHQFGYSQASLSAVQWKYYFCVLTGWQDANFVFLHFLKIFEPSNVGMRTKIQKMCGNKYCNWTSIYSSFNVLTIVKAQNASHSSSSTSIKFFLKLLQFLKLSSVYILTITRQAGAGELHGASLPPSSFFFEPLPVLLLR